MIDDDDKNKFKKKLKNRSFFRFNTLLVCKEKINKINVGEGN